MNDNERYLLRAVVENNNFAAKRYAKIILSDIKTERDRAFKEELLKQIEKQEKFIDIPSNLRGILVAEDCSEFREDRFIVRESEENLLQQVSDALVASDRLKQVSIRYVPSFLLHGESGTGKTYLCRYLAYKLNLPFVYVKFSNLMNSYLGGTSTNLSRIFDFIRSTRCVFCFDEIDAIALSRGTKSDLGEMNRIAISLMQELDTLENGTILIGTTNRYSAIDPAILHRFSYSHEVLRLNQADAITLATKFFASVGLDSNKFDLVSTQLDFVTAEAVVKECIQHIVKEFITDINKENTNG